MNFLTIRAWENADPYEGKCTEDRCVKGKRCYECNAGKEYDEEMKCYVEKDDVEED